MEHSKILNIIEKINDELNKNSKDLSVTVTCYIETKNHIYSGKYDSFKNGVILLTNSYLCDTSDDPIKLDNTYIQLDKEDIVAFSYNPVSQNIL